METVKWYTKKQNFVSHIMNEQYNYRLERPGHVDKSRNGGEFHTCNT
jgi:hypothetical protein